MEKESITITESELISAASKATSKVISKMVDDSKIKLSGVSILATTIIAALLVSEMQTTLFSGGDGEVKA